MSRLTKPRAATGMQIVCVESESRFAVHSASGSQYEIHYAGSGDGDPEYLSLWECTCPAAQNGRDCKHMQAFLDSGMPGADEGDRLVIGADGEKRFIPGN